MHRPSIPVALALAALLLAPVTRADEPAPTVDSPATTPPATVENPTPSPTPAATPVPAATTPPAPATTPATPPDPWLQYADAAELGLGKNVREADAVLESLEKANPGHPAAERATKLRALLVPALTAATPAMPARQIDPLNPATWLRPEGVEPLARAELAFVQAVHGIVLGAEFCGVIGNCSAQLTAVALIAGGGAGLGLSLALSGEGVQPGHTLALDSGTLWGAWHGLAMNFILSSSNSAVVYGLPMAGQLVGLGAGHFLWSMLKPAVGDVSLANSGGIWLGVLSGLLVGASGATLSGQQFWGTILAASDVGLILGAVASSYLPMSRGRTLILDAGAIIGLVFGAAIGLFTNASGQTYFALMSAGVVAGGAGAFWLTRNWDKPPPAFAPQLSVVPTQGGLMAMAGWQL